MREIELLTATYDLQKMLATNGTAASSFASRVPTIVEPTGAGVFDIGGGQNAPGNVLGPNNLFCQFYGVGSDTNTFKVRVIGWNVIAEPTNLDRTKRMWVPAVLAEVTCTIKSAIAPATAGALLTTEYMADTIVVVGTSGNQGVGDDFVSPADGAMPGHVLIDLRGCQKVEFLFHRNSSATSCNGLFKKL